MKTLGFSGVADAETGVEKNGLDNLGRGWVVGKTLMNRVWVISMTY